MALVQYWKKRDFKKTKEPSGNKTKTKATTTTTSVRARQTKALSFVVQKHDASHLHYDFRLEFEGVLKSWAVPKGPSFDPAEKRLAVEVEDHPIDYASFEGVIPAGEYGGGDVIVWDRGTWTSEKDIAESLKQGRLEFSLKGKKLGGSWVLVRTGRPSKKPHWLLIKRHDEFAKSHDEYDVVAEHPESVKTGHLLPRDEGETRKAKRKPTKSVVKADFKAGGKKKAQKFPGFIAPQLAKFAEAAPQGGDWVHEIKFDGYRALVTLDGKKAKFWTRARNDWTDRYGTLVQEFEKLGSKDGSKSVIENIIVDGEIVSIDEDGKTNFSQLQNTLSDVRLKGARDGGKSDKENLVYYVFDILWLNGVDLRERPLIERKALLEKLLKTLRSDRIRYSEHWLQEGPDVLRAACEKNLEGIISKRVDATYESTRSGAWLKSKCTKGQEFIIGGYSSPKGGRKGFGSILLGAFDDTNRLRYVGRVGTGFNEATLTSLLTKLKKLKTNESPFEVSLPTERDITFVKPKLVCRIIFGEWTKDKIVRHAVFDGLREDKDASLVKIETEAKTTTNDFNLTHPDKVLYPDVGVTKKEMAEYYKLVQDRILPHVTNRPLSLVRCPDGAGKECFFQKKLGLAKGKELRSRKLKGKEHDEEILTIDSVEGLYELVQMGVLEIHNWGCHVPKINKADLIVFDLDPDEGLNWRNVKEAAFELKELLENLNLKTWIKTTGGKGLHIHVPILPEHSFDEIKAFSLSVVQFLEKKHPDRYTSQSAFKKRKGRIFLDYLRNGYGATSVTPYSLRASSTASIAVPIAWSELRGLKGADLFTIHTIERRLRAGKDPWLGYFSTRQRLDLGGK